MKKVLSAILASAMLLPALVAVSSAEPIQYKGYTIPDIVLDNKEAFPCIYFEPDFEKNKNVPVTITWREAIEQAETIEPMIMRRENRNLEDFFRGYKEAWPDLFEVSQTPIDPDEATIVYPEPGVEYYTDQIRVTLKAQYSRSVYEDKYTVEDFPELELSYVTHMGRCQYAERDLNGYLRNPHRLDLSINYNNCCLSFSPELGISLEEALERIAQNPMVLKAEPIKYEVAEPCDDELIELPMYYNGDANGDHKVNSKDIITVMKYMLGQTELTRNGFFAADVNHDGEVNAKDIIGIMKLMIQYAAV